jgi:hypothetical protein
MKDVTTVPCGGRSRAGTVQPYTVHHLTDIAVLVEKNHGCIVSKKCKYSRSISLHVQTGHPGLQPYQILIGLEAFDSNDSSLISPPSAAG